MQPMRAFIFMAASTCLACSLPLAYPQNGATEHLTVTHGFEMSVPASPSYRGGSMVLLNRETTLLAYGKPRDLRAVPLGTVRIYGVTSKNGGKTWGEERMIEHNPACQTGRPSFLRSNDGTIWMFYYGFVRLSERAQSSQSDLWAVRSHDNGQSWIGRQRIFKGFTGATNGAIETASGRMIVPFSYMVDPMRLVSACVVSSDRGKTWKLSEAIDLGDLGGYGDHAGALEPTVVELRDGRIWMMIRTQKGEFYQAFSNDQALTWTDPTPTGILSPNAPGFVTRFASGRLALLWNLINEEQAVTWRRGDKPTTGQRDKLAIALSHDEGRSWSKPVVCAQAKEISYPSVLETSRGNLLISSGRLRKPELEMDTIVLRISEEALLKLSQGSPFRAAGSSQPIP